jgi:hypothetical protein
MRAQALAVALGSFSTTLPVQVMRSPTWVMAVKRTP